MPQTLSAVDLHVIWRETNTRLDVLAGRVREGLDVDAASEFARWLRFSGILRVLCRNECEVPFPVRGRELEAKAAKLVSDCGDWYANHERSNIKPNPQVPVSQLEAINAKLDQLLSERNERGGTIVEFPKVA